MGQLPAVGPGERVVLKADGKGGWRISVEKVDGRAFVASADCSGYVLDARLLQDVLGSLKMPGSWFQVWHKMTAAQDATREGEEQRRAPRGYIRMTQRDLQARCGLSAASVSEGSQFFAHIGWTRAAKRGIIQLNPWLTVAGTSVEQKLWQQEWNDAKGPTLIIPEPKYPAEWRALRAAEKKEKEATRKPRKVVALSSRKRNVTRRASA